MEAEKNSAVQSDRTNESPSPSKLTTAKMSSAFASFTQRMQQATPPSGPTNGEQPADAQSSEPVKKESSSLSISKLSSFTDRIKAKSTNSPDSAVTADAPAPSSTIEKSEGEKPADPSTTGVTDTTDGRLSKFTMSMSTSLSAMRDKVAEARADSISSNNKDEEEKSVSNVDSSAAEAKLSKFTQSIGGSLAGMSKKPFFSNTTTATAQSTNQKKISEHGQAEESEFSKTLTSLGRILTEDAPRPKTRFQRADEEEVVSFDGDGDTDEAPTTVSTVSDDLLLSLDSDLDTALADVSLTDSGEEKAPTTIDETPTETAES